MPCSCPKFSVDWNMEFDITHAGFSFLIRTARREVCGNSFSILLSLGSECECDITSRRSGRIVSIEGYRATSRRYPTTPFLCLRTMLRCLRSSVLVLLIASLLLSVAYAQDTSLRVVKATFDEAQVSFEIFYVYSWLTLLFSSMLMSVSI